MNNKEKEGIQRLRDTIKELFEQTSLKVHKHYLPPEPETPYQHFRWLLAAGLLLSPEYRFRSPNLDWIQDLSFTDYLDSFNVRYELNSGRYWNLAQFLKLTAEVPGDTAECGCYTGASSYLICKDNRASSFTRRHHIFDSFEGLSQPVAKDGEHWEEGALSFSEQGLKDNLHSLGDDIFSVYKGWIPERFDEVADKTFSFVHVDVDLYEPTRDSLAFFYPRLNKGGILLCDDYGSSLCPGATKAMEEYILDKVEPLISLASGGSFVIKKT